jgi:hypothetical protein
MKNGQTKRRLQMRLLANYGYRNNGDSYSVTFETTGDVPMEKAEETIDDLFRMAKEAVQRQIDGELDFPPKEEVVSSKAVVVTIPRVATPSHNGNENGGGNGATDKQKAFLKKLHADKRKGVNIDVLSKAEASELIKSLMEVVS